LSFNKTDVHRQVNKEFGCLDKKKVLAQILSLKGKRKKVFFFSAIQKDTH